MISEELLNKCTTPSEKETANLFDSLGLKCIDLSFKIKNEKGNDTGEIDGIFIDEENEIIIIYDESKQSKKPNDKITKFFTKWSNNSNEDKIFEGLEDLPHYPIHILYINKVQEASETDLSSIEYLLKNNMNIIHKDDYEYFLNLSENIGVWAKNDLYNFLNIFPPQSRIELEATQIYIGNTPAYVFADKADKILKYSYVSRRRQKDEGYQRMIDLKRVNEIKKKIENGEIKGFVNSVLLNSTIKISSTPLQKSHCPKIVKISIPNHFSSCRIVDGQHRILSFSKLSKVLQTKFQLPVVLIDNMNIEDEIELFLEINNNAKSVDPNLEYELISRLSWNDDDKNFLIKEGVKLVSQLEKNNPLKGNLYKGIVGDTKKDKITLISIVNSIIKNKFIDFEIGLLQISKNDLDTPKKLIQIALTEINKSSNNGDYFFSNRGIDLLFNYMSHFLTTNTNEKSIEENIKDSMTDFIEIVNENIDELSKFQGASGSKQAIDLVVLEINKKS